MEKQHRDILMKRQPYLLENLLIGPAFLAQLISMFIINFDDQELMLQGNLTTVQKVSHFCKLIVRKGPKAFEGLLQALSETDQAYIREELEKDLQTCEVATLRLYTSEADKCKPNEKTHHGTKEDMSEHGEMFSLSMSDLKLLSPFIHKAHNGLTATQLAVNESNVNVLQLLIKSGADMKILDDEKQNLLHRASRVGNIDIIDYLLREVKDLSVNSFDKNNRTPLHVSIMSGHHATSRHLIENCHANITMVDSYNRDPLFVACQFGDLHTAQILLDKGASYTTKGSYSSSALDAACFHGHVDIARMLLDRGADVNVCRDNGVTPLYVACEYGHIAVAELLLTRGAMVNVRESTGFTPLHVACYYGHTAVAELLLQNGVHLAAGDSDGATPFFVACQHGHKDVVELLLSLGAEVNGRAAGCNNNTPLHVACVEGRHQVVGVLLGKGADINAQNKYQYTALHYACREGHKLTVQALLQYPTLDTHILNKQKQTARDLAESRGHREIRTLIPSNKRKH